MNSVEQSEVTVKITLKLNTPTRLDKWLPDVIQENLEAGEEIVSYKKVLDLEEMN